MPHVAGEGMALHSVIHIQGDLGRYAEVHYKLGSGAANLDIPDEGQKREIAAKLKAMGN